MSEDSFGDEVNRDAARTSAATTGRMTRRKEESTSGMASAAEEMERLRLRQGELERERRELEDLSRRQEDYEKGRKDILEKLDRSVVWVQREKSQADRMVEILSETHARFKVMLDELRNINEDNWPEDGFQEELNRALTSVEIANSDYRKALARIEASSWHKAAADGEKEGGMQVMGELVPSGRDFGYWVKVGFAVSVPLMAFLILVGILVLVVVRGR